MLYENRLPFEEKLIYVYNFDRDVFPEMYPPGEIKTRHEISHAEPVMKLPHDEIYIAVLAEYYFRCVGDRQSALAMAALFESAVEKYKATHISGINVRHITSWDINGVPTAWVDDLGGVHDGGCGTDPYGNDCGECSAVTCFGCKVLQNTKYKEEE